MGLEFVWLDSIPITDSRHSYRPGVVTDTATPSRPFTSHHLAFAIASFIIRKEEAGGSLRPTREHVS